MKYSLLLLLLLSLSSCLSTTSMLRPDPRDPEYEKKYKIYMMELKREQMELDIRQRKLDYWFN